MKKKEAEVIIDEYLYWEDASCSCHINPPCQKCVKSPSEEQYKEAQKVLEEAK